MTKLAVVASSFLVMAQPISAARASATRLSPQMSRKIDADVEQAMARLQVPGAAVLILEGGRVAYVRGYGFRDKERRLPVTPKTAFEIGSITKQFTAAAILQLQAAGRLDLDRPLSDYLPDAPHAREVTLRQLLSHTSGLHDYLDLPEDRIDEFVQRPITYKELIARLAPLPLDFKPGSRWSYSNTGYLLLGRVIEIVSGETYRDYLQRHFFGPLHLTSTHTIGDEPRLANMAKGYRHAHGALERGPTMDVSWAGAAGFLVTTLADLARWDVALESGRVIPPNAYREMATEATTKENGGTGYGLGLFVGEAFGQPRIGHTGASLSFTAADENFPRQRTRIIALTNLGDEEPEAGEVLTNVAFGALYPPIVAAAERPSPGEDPEVRRSALAAFEELQTGKSYRAFGDKLQTKLTGDLGERLASRLGPYGSPTASIFRGERESDGQSWFDYTIKFGPGVYLPLSVRLDGGKVAGFSVG